MTTQTPNPTTIDPKSLQQLRQQETVLLVDVREPLKYVGEHLADAISLPLSKFQPEQLGLRI